MTHIPNAINPHADQPTSLAALGRSLWRHRLLIVQMTRREVAGRYKGSAMGQPSGIKLKVTSQSQGTGSGRFVVLISNRKRILSQNAAAKPGNSSDSSYPKHKFLD